MPSGSGFTTNGRFEAVNDVSTNPVHLPLRLRESKFQHLWLLLSSLGFVAIGWSLEESAPSRNLGLAFFGFCTAVALVLMFHPCSGYLELTPTGFTYCTYFRPLTYKWTSVADFGVDKGIIRKYVGFNFAPEIDDSPGFEGNLPGSYGMAAEDLVDLLRAVRLQCIRKPEDAGQS